MGNFGTNRISVLYSDWAGMRYLGFQEEQLTLVPTQDQAQTFEVQSTDGKFSLRATSSELYMGYEGEPEEHMGVGLFSDRRERVTIAVTGTSVSPPPAAAISRWW
ncbi:hypothetical protein AB0H34_18490 [Saccharopolyspora shandongensis]|uniref:hypothetical protein n=1 Tax=Saccharopolyspora shandongensis TaxID=418495 RepID=UPI0033E47CC9